MYWFTVLQEQTGGAQRKQVVFGRVKLDEPNATSKHNGITISFPGLSSGKKRRRAPKGSPGNEGGGTYQMSNFLVHTTMINQLRNFLFV